MFHGWMELATRLRSLGNPPGRQLRVRGLESNPESSLAAPCVLEQVPSPPGVSGSFFISGSLNSNAIKLFRDSKSLIYWAPTVYWGAMSTWDSKINKPWSLPSRMPSLSWGGFGDGDLGAQKALHCLHEDSGFVTIVLNT